MRLKSGYSWETIQANIATLQSTPGVPRDKAPMLAYSHARVSYFKRFPAGALPDYLRFKPGMTLAKHYANGWPVFAARGSNPVPPAQITEAGQRYKAFSGHDPEEIDKVSLPGQGSRAAWVLGQLDFVGYTTVRDGVTESYKHAFRKKSRPLLAVTHDGGELLIVQGDYHVTERGIEDK